MNLRDPQLAQVAIQQAALLAKNIEKIAEGADDGDAQLALEVFELQRLHPHDYLCHKA